MARAPVLGNLGLNPFGGGGVSFDAFNLAASQGETAYLAFRKQEILWEQGKLSNADYLTALKNYGNALTAGTSEQANAVAKYESTKYRVDRNQLVAAVTNGTRNWSDLLAFDQQKLSEVTATDSQEYIDRLSNVRDVQAHMFADAEDTVRRRYNEGQMTATQLLSWYQGQGGLTANNPDLADTVSKRIEDVGQQVIAEQDQKVVSDFNDGKIGYNQFIAYANGAQARYAKGTTQYDDWTTRLSDAKDQAVEQSLLYRQGLTARYQQLAKFVKDHGTAPTGGTSTSKGTTRLVWDGKGWKTVTTGGGTKSYGPSKSEVAAWGKVKAQVADAKKQMAQIVQQIGKQPGGWVTTKDMIRYYAKIQTKYAKGSPEWYNVQSRLDGLNQQLHAETILAKSGIKVSYPHVKSEGPEYGTGAAPGQLPPGASANVAGTGSAASSMTYASAAQPSPKSPSKASKDKTITIDEFMRAIAKVESGGRYDARNKNSGARGKYQIMPSNWAGWAKKYLGDANAEWSPANQEKVAKGKFQDLYKWLGDWRAVAHWWLTGGSNKDLHLSPAQWSKSSTTYVNKVFRNLGMGPTAVSSTAVHTAKTGGGVAPSTGAAAGSTHVGTTHVAAGNLAPTVHHGATAPGKATAKLPGGEVIYGGKSPLDLPKGLDAAQFERFYEGYLSAYKNGDHYFIDYSSGKAVSYYIPFDVTQRSELIHDLDKIRISAYAAKANAYAGTPSGNVAATAYSNAIKKAGENQLLILDTWDARVYPTPTARSMTGTAYVPPRTGGPQPPAKHSMESASKAINPIAAADNLRQQTEAGLTLLAKQAKDALARGDDEAAYTYIQQATDLAASTEATLQVYHAKAVATAKAIMATTGAKMPAQVASDLQKLVDSTDFNASDGSVYSGYASQLKSLDETSAEIEKYIQFGSDGEPVLQPGNTKDDIKFTYKPGVTLQLKPDGTIEHTTTKNTGWLTPTSPSKDNGKTVAVSVLIGSSVKEVQAQWESATVGFVEGTNVPIQSKQITGVDPQGKPYVWIENPFAPGKWIRTDGSKPLNIKVPTGFRPVVNPDGSVDLEFKSGGGPKGGGSTYRLVYNKDGSYHVMQPPGMFDTSGQWTDLGSPSSSPGDITPLLSSAGWSVDRSTMTGDDSYFFDSNGAWIGFTKGDYETVIKSTQSRLSTHQPVPTPSVMVNGGRINDRLTDNRPAPSTGAPVMVNGGRINDHLTDSPGGPVTKTSLPAIGAVIGLSLTKVGQPKMTGTQANAGKAADDIVRPATKPVQTASRTAAAKKPAAKPVQLASRTAAAKAKTPAPKPSVQVAGGKINDRLTDASVPAPVPLVKRKIL